MEAPKLLEHVSTTSSLNSHVLAGLSQVFLVFVYLHLNNNICIYIYIHTLHTLHTYTYIYIYVHIQYIVDLLSGFWGGLILLYHQFWRLCQKRPGDEHNATISTDETLEVEGVQCALTKEDELVMCLGFKCLTRWWFQKKITLLFGGGFLWFQICLIYT